VNLHILASPLYHSFRACSYRKIEQTNNINDLNISTIVAANNDISPVAFADLCQKMMQVKKGEPMLPGNDEAIKSILHL